MCKFVRSVVDVENTSLYLLTDVFEDPVSISCRMAATMDEGGIDMH
jgi:hypothetical protein